MRRWGRTVPVEHALMFGSALSGEMHMSDQGLQAADHDGGDGAGPRPFDAEAASPDLHTAEAASPDLSTAEAASVLFLDAQGLVLAVSGGSRCSGRATGTAGLVKGSDYFAACELATSEPVAAVVVDGLRALAAGTIGELTLEYPTHHLDETRWFRLVAQRLSDAEPIRLLVIHDEVSAGRSTHNGDRAGVTLFDDMGGAVTANDLDGAMALWDPAGRRTQGQPTQQSIEQLQAITDNIGDGLCTLDSAGHVTFVNPAGQRMLRSSMAGVLGGSFLRWPSRSTSSLFVTR